MVIGTLHVSHRTMTKSQEDKIKEINRVFTFRDALPWVVPISLFLIAGVYFSETTAPIFFIPFIILLSLVVIRILNRQPDKADRVAEVLYGQLLESCFKEGYSYSESPLSSEDVQGLQSMVSYGYRFKPAAIQGFLNQNKKVIIKGYLTSKNWTDGELYWVIAKTYRVETSKELYYSATVGDFVEMEIARNEKEWISVYKPDFILQCKVPARGYELLKSHEQIGGTPTSSKSVF